MILACDQVIQALGMVLHMVMAPQCQHRCVPEAVSEVEGKHNKNFQHIQKVNGGHWYFEHFFIKMSHKINN